MFAKTRCNWTGQHKGTKDNIFSIEVQDGNKKKTIISTEMDHVIRKKDKELETTRAEAQIGKRIDTTGGGYKQLQSYRNSRWGMCLKVWDGLASRCYKCYKKTSIYICEGLRLTKKLSTMDHMFVTNARSQRFFAFIVQYRHSLLKVSKNSPCQSNA
jgi:hypothetical protein